MDVEHVRGGCESSARGLAALAYEPYDLRVLGRGELLPVSLVAHLDDRPHWAPVANVVFALEDCREGGQGGLIGEECKGVRVTIVGAPTARSSDACG